MEIDEDLYREKDGTWTSVLTISVNGMPTKRMEFKGFKNKLAAQKVQAAIEQVASSIGVPYAHEFVGGG